MVNTSPFVLTTFCPNGDPNGLRIVTKSNWSGEGVICSRSLLPEVESEYFEKPGVYVLVGTCEGDDDDDSNDDDPLLYIGEADPVSIRLHQHCSGDRDFWTWCISFMGADINKAHIQYLEASLIKIARDARRAKLDNQNTPAFPNLSPQQEAIASGFLSEMLSIFPIVGLNAFQKLRPHDDKRLFLKQSGIEAIGYETQGGFVVMKDSQAVTSHTHKCPLSIIKMRKKLKKNNVLAQEENNLIFTEDYFFETPAKAAGVIIGHTATRSYWKDNNGKSMGMNL